MGAAKRARGAALAAALAAGLGCSQGSKVNEVTALTPETHGGFPIASGTHAGVDCNACHGEFDTFSRFSCLGCHTKPDTDPHHAGVAGYAWESEACLGCHPTGGDGEAVDHARIFPIDSGSAHEAVACRECHVSPTSRKLLGCDRCHAHPGATLGPSHAAVGGFDPSAAMCARCHGDSQVDRVSAHLPFGITASYDHYRTRCLDCHPQMRADKPFAADFSRASVDCLRCHERSEMDDQHSGQPGYRYESQTCLNSGCHANGRKPED